MPLLKRKNKSKKEAGPFGSYLDEHLKKEWLLTNSRGGYSSSTQVNCNTRKYHGLLVGALTPPANRIVSLANCMETLTVDDRHFNLSTFEFENAVHPAGHEYLVSFRQDTGVHFDYEIEGVRVTRSIYLLSDRDVVAVKYSFANLTKPIHFTVRPLAALRDFHATGHGHTGLSYKQIGHRLVIQSDNPYCGKLFLYGAESRFREESQWWYQFAYRCEKRRGMEYLEDLWSPGVFTWEMDEPGEVVFWAGLGKDESFADTFDVDFDIAMENLQLEEKDDVPEEYTKDPILADLCKSAGRFIVERNYNERTFHTILAGYPWFLDWGRDAFISLEGLLLCTKRFEQAFEVLSTFASAVDQGMIPNRFDDYGDPPHYNSVDASLWFIHAAFAYLRYTSDNRQFEELLLPAITRIIDSYRRGTRFDIHADQDGLITAGSPETQLTWMDAKCGDAVFTPRYGKAVEVNALWYNALSNMADFYDKNEEKLTEYFYFRGLADKVGDSFVNLFWDDQRGYLADCIHPDGFVDIAVRPNQIFAVSLPHSPLSQQQKEKVLARVQDRLLTPYGLRSLCPKHSNFEPLYEGDQFERDRAYHNGTVWAFLIGPFVEAWLKVYGSGRKSRSQARDFIQPLIDHFYQDGCLYSVNEVFDGGVPHRHGGCFAQAWSVAELLRAYMLTR